MKRIITYVAIIVCIGCFLWAYTSGKLNGLVSFIFGVLTVLFGISISNHDNMNEIRKQLDKTKVEMEEKEKEIKEMRERHDKEVAEVEQAHSDDSFSELLAGANERERKRRRHMGE